MVEVALFAPEALEEVVVEMLHSHHHVAVVVD